MEAVINNTKLIRRVNIFALLILAVCVCAVAFLCKNMWLHIACTAALFLVMTIPEYSGRRLYDKHGHSLSRNHPKGTSDSG